MIIIKAKPVFEWTSFINFTLHFSQHGGTLIFLILIVFVCCCNAFPHLPRAWVSDLRHLVQVSEVHSHLAGALAYLNDGDRSQFNPVDGTLLCFWIQAVLDRGVDGAFDGRWFGGSSSERDL